jgi:hypothetical protein
MTRLVNSSFEVSFNYWLGSRGINNNNYTYKDTNGNVSSFKFCTDIPSIKIYTDANMKFSATGYSQNYHYYTNASLTNVTTEQALYLLNSSKSTITQLQIVDEYQNGVPGDYIQVQYYDIGTGRYYLVGMAKTNYDGSDLIYLNWYDTFYKFVGTDSSGNVIFNYDPYKVGATPQIFRLSGDNTFAYDKFKNIQYSLYYNNATQNVVLTFLDPSGKITSGCLKITQPSTFNSRTIYDECLSSTSGTITYNMVNETGKFVAIFYATGSFDYIKTISIVIGDIRGEIYKTIDKKDSAIYAFIIVGSAVFIGLFSPAVAVVFGLIGWIAAASLGFINFDWYVFIPVALIGIYIAWKLRV